MTHAEPVRRSSAFSLLLALALFAVPQALSTQARAGVTCEQRADYIERLETLLDRKGGARAKIERKLDRVAWKQASQCVHMNQVQVLGTHNSYHIEPIQQLIDIYIGFDPSAPELQYTHRTLTEQLEDLGIRQFELDVFHDPDGGRYSEPFGLKIELNDQNARDPGFDPPGMKVQHIQEIDWKTRCYLLVDCLAEIKAFSDANPKHLPIAIMIEVKDDAFPDPGLGFVQALPFDAEAFDLLDAEIRSVFPESQMITPDQVRGDFATLEEAVLTRGWPTLGKARGRVVFLMDNRGKRDIYLDGHPSLAGRVLFTDARPGEDDAAFVKQNGSVGNEANIADLVGRGYLVRTRADAGTIESRNDDFTTADAALVSGAQYVSSDYPEPDPRFSPYFVEIPDGMPGRCNPINAPRGCRNGALER